jgi:hypothetical protein
MIKPITLLIFIFSFTFVFGQAIKVEVKNTAEGYQLYRGGKPYYIKGAGGKGQIDELLYVGGNSIRTWGVDEADDALKKAEENNLTVMFGLWVQHERHGFDYNNEEAVAQQLANFTKVVEKYKDHPNVLLWGIGNEVDLFYSNTKVWDAIQDIAAMIHKIDPNHPTTTVTAGLDSNEVQEVLKRAPDIDIYGFNTYGDIGTHSANIRKFGWNGPYIISEWGPNGHWEVAKTEWGAPIEQTSTEKAASYRQRYQDYIASKKDQCIGSYVFLWGQKQETTSTWYGLFTADGEPTEPVDELYKFWQNQKPPNNAPSVSDLILNGKKAEESIKLKAGFDYMAEVKHKDIDGDKVDVDWFIYPESSNTKAGGDFENSLQPILGTLSNRKDNSVKVQAPSEEGAYRLFVFVRDKGERTAYANIPFYVIPRKPTDPQPNGVWLKTRQLEVDR